MNWLDITLLCLAGIGFVKGLFDGVIKQVPEQGVTVLSYVAGFLLIVGVILLAGEILTRVVGATPLSVLNHLVGGVLGLCFMMAFVSLLLNSMEMIDKGSVLIPRQAKVESRFYNSVKEIIPTIYFQNLFFKEE